MEGVEEKLGAILGNPQMMQQIMALAQSMGSQPQTPPPPTPQPGGIDPVGALRHGTRVISAQSLPGRVAPVTAGKIIARCVLEEIEGDRA